MWVISFVCCWVTFSSKFCFIILWWVMDVGGPYLHISHRALGEGNHRGAQTSLCRGPAPQMLSPASQMVVLFVCLFFLLTGCDVTCCPKCLPGVQGRTAYLRLVTMLYLGSIHTVGKSNTEAEVNCKMLIYFRCLFI